MKKIFSSFIVLVTVLVLLNACGNDMRDHSRYKPFEKTPFFEDGRVVRPQVEGTVARGDLREDDALYTGKIDGKPIESLPVELTEGLLQRGRERFDIFCAVCHDRAGTGQGMIVQRGFKQPPSFHEERLRNIPVGYFYDVISNGFGTMSGYAGQITPEDRWAIAAYIRALQLSQHTDWNTLPEEEKQKVSASESK